MMYRANGDFRFKLVMPVNGAPVGTRFALCENTYATEVCDVCGKKKCDFFECQCLRPITGFDCCRTCRKQALVEE